MKNQFLQGTLILVCSSVLLKVLGFAYQIFVIRAIGTEAIGIVNMAQPFYMALVIFSTMSMPMAISRMVAQAYAREEQGVTTKIMRNAFRLVGVLSVLAVAVAIVIVPRLFQYLNADSRLRWCFYMLLPGIVIVPFTSVLRGYFQGRCKMLAPSVGQLVEQILRIGIGMIVVTLLKGRNVLYIAMGLAGAMIVGELGGCMVLLLLYCKERKKEQFTDKSKKGVLHEMFSLGIPATLTKLTSTCDMMIEAWLMPWCFWQGGATRSMAAKMYGDLSGVAFNLLAIPNILTSALVTMLIPTVAQNSLQQNKQKLERSCGKVLALTYMCACPIVMVIYCYGDALIYFIFAIEGLGKVVQNLCYGAMFIYLGQTIVGILQGLGKNRVVFVNNFCGSFLKIAGIYYFAYIMGSGLEGAVWGFVLGYGGQCLLNFFCLIKNVRIKILRREIFLPAILTGAFYYTLPIAQRMFSFLPQMGAISGAILLNCGIYFLILMGSKTFSLKLFEDDCNTM